MSLESEGIDLEAIWERARKSSELALGISRRDGIPWHVAPKPRRLHHCTPWTTSFQADRCACGAIRMSGFRGWIERNSR